MLQKFNRALPLPCLLGEVPVYVNAKQFHRILKMRAKRAAQRQIRPAIRKDGKYKYESRHQHAQARQRNDKGRFLSDIEKPVSSTLDEEKGNFEHEGNYKGRNVKKKCEEEHFFCPLSGVEESSFLDQERLMFLNNENEDYFLNHQDSFLQIDTDAIQQYFEEAKGVQIEPGSSPFEV